ncbi:MAG: hypothetical protein ABSA84_04330 [Gammaproteobacteria bacterium]
MVTLPISSPSCTSVLQTESKSFNSCGIKSDSCCCNKILFFVFCYGNVVVVVTGNYIDK